MKLRSTNTTETAKYFSPVLTAALITTSLWQLLPAATAAPINPTIENQATATYEDPDKPAKTNDPNDPNLITTVSNVIKIISQEVAGITVRQNGITDESDKSLTSLKGGDTAYFRFDLTNTGNDGTQIFIPSKATISSIGTLQKVQYFDETAKQWQDIPASGYTTGNIDLAKIVKVRVAVKISDAASDEPISVSLGQTTPTANAQNIEIPTPNLANLKQTNRVFTIDNADTTEREIIGLPANGTREAMATQTIKIEKGIVVLNGSKDNAQSIGENGDNNQDFTNKATPVAGGIKRGDKFNPDPVGFINTVKNGSDTATDIKIVPAIKVDEPLPEGTIITLKDPKKPNDSGVSYKVNSVGGIVPVDATKLALILAQVPAQGSVDYITGIDLPIDTSALKGYPISLIAFIDRNNDNLPNPTELQNKTLDRLYTGFIEMLKESRVLGVDKKPLNDFSVDPKITKPGQFIEYQIKFSNISTVVPAGSDSRGLAATNFTITEDGSTGVNNWAALTTNDPNSASATMGTLTFSPTNDTNNRGVKTYINNVGTLVPQASGVFSFTRQLN
jgi:hypothetical protein